MTTNPNNFTPTVDRHTRRRTGSVTIFVVVLLAFLFLMGTAYLQSTRLVREAGGKTSGDIDAVTDAIVSQISTTLTDDLVDSSNHFFTGAIEPYDHPWTADVNWTVQDDSGANQTARGNQNDDTWLAASSPDFSTPSKPAWPHLTNLNGIFLRLPTAGNTVVTTIEEDIVDLSATVKSDTSITITGGGPNPTLQDQVDGSGATETDYEQLGVDADGDGIEDSRWAWAPLRQINGIKYVMAVRIIDNSSMINVGVAQRLSADGSNNFYSSQNGPHGYYPTDLDLARLLEATTAVAWSTELDALLSLRGVASPGTFGLSDLAQFPATGSYTANTTRLGNWLESVRKYVNPFFKLTIDDELEFRYHNGLNNAKVTSTLENILPTLLRSAASENTYDNVPGVAANAAGMGDFFQGGSGNLSGRSFPEARHMLTTRSGATVLAANYNDIFAGARTLKYDLLHDDGGPTTATPGTRIDSIATRLSDIFGIGTSGLTTYLGLGTGVGPDQIDAVAREFALAIQDYSDADSIPSQSTMGAVTYCGMETLPFLREAYFQAGYLDTDQVLPNGVANFDTWVVQNNSRAVAIELGNPFDRDIPLATTDPNTLDNRIKIVIEQGGSPVDSYVISGLAGNLGSRNKLVFYSNAATAVAEGTKGSNLTSDLVLGSAPADVTRVALSDGELIFNTNGSDITILLQVDVGPSGTPQWVTYDRLTVTGANLANTYAHISAPQASPRHRQVSMRRDGQTIRYISNNGKGIVSPRDVIADNTYKIRSDGVAGLEQDSKGVSGDTSLDDFQLPVANRPILNVAELGWIQMFGFYKDTSAPEVGDFPQRLDSLALKRRNLDFTATATVPTETGIPHAAMAMDQFTTSSPANDGVDNDDDGANDNLDAGGEPTELFVPGLINVNTAPVHVAAMAAPIPDSGVNDTQDLFDSIADYRDNPNNRTTGNNYPNNIRPAGAGPNYNNKGIASIGELMFINPGSGTDNMQSESNIATNSAFNQFPVPTVETASPFPYPATPYVTDGHAEEKTARYQFLSQTFTTRSDIYTAYVVVRGYSVTGQNQDPVESARFIAVFDRSNVLTKDDKPRVIAFRKLD